MEDVDKANRIAQNPKALNGSKASRIELCVFCGYKIFHQVELIKTGSDQLISESESDLCWSGEASHLKNK